MSLNKLFLILLAAIVIPFTTADAAKTRTKKSSHKTSVSKKSSKKNSKKSSSSKKTVKITDAASASTSSKAKGAELANIDDVSGETVVKTAMQYLGVPYRYGTSSPKSFDCSGFTSYVFKQYDISLSRCSRTQYTQGHSVKNTELRAGDLVFFQGRSGKGGVGHVGIVAEVHNDKTFTFVHASCSKGITTEKSTTAYYKSRYIGARRILADPEE